MSSELYVLARRLDRISEQHRWSRDFTQNSLHLALAEVIACFPVYRTYTQATLHRGQRRRSPARRCARSATPSAATAPPASRCSTSSPTCCCCAIPTGCPTPSAPSAASSCCGCSSSPGPVMAKGLEDTVFYRYFPLASLNEVGGRPDRRRHRTVRGCTPGTRAAWRSGRTGCRRPRRTTPSAARTCARASTCCPRSRANGSSVVRHWQRLNRRLKSIVDDVRIPGANEEYLIYQTLIGAWPMDAIDADLTDAAREALRSPHQRLHDQGAARGQAAHELDQRERALRARRRAVHRPAAAAVQRRRRSSPSCGASWARILIPGICNSLAQVVLKVTAPGRPRLLPGDRAVGSVAGRSRQPAAGRLRACGARCWPSSPARAEARPARACARELLRQPARRRDQAAGDRAAPCSTGGDHRALYDRGDYVPLQWRATRTHTSSRSRAALGGATSITVVGRLLRVARRRPSSAAGRGRWGDTRIVLPPSSAARRLSRRR